MFNPEKYKDIESFTSEDVISLPIAEDDRHEYKSSQTKNDLLADKIACAASAFWNSGGGLFVVGVNGKGQADGGVELTVGRQTRRDWIDQAISRVSPRAPYVVQCIEAGGSNLNIEKDKAVILIGFATSEGGPHMAPDNRYYIRAGAHTVPASHFLVEAIYARRGLRSPILKHIVRRKPENNNVLQLGIICLNDAPVLNVEIELDPLPEWLCNFKTNFPLLIPVISREAPFYLDFHMVYFPSDPKPVFHVNLKYSDLTMRPYETIFPVDPNSQVGPCIGGVHF